MKYDEDLNIKKQNLFDISQTSHKTPIIKELNTRTKNLNGKLIPMKKESMT